MLGISHWYVPPPMDFNAEFFVFFSVPCLRVKQSKLSKLKPHGQMYKVVHKPPKWDTSLPSQRTCNVGISHFLEQQNHIHEYITQWYNSGQYTIIMANILWYNSVYHPIFCPISGSFLHSYWKSPFFMGKSTINGHFPMKNGDFPMKNGDFP